MEKTNKREDLTPLARAAHDDAGQLGTLWCAARRLAVYWANKHSAEYIGRHGLERDDLVQLYAEALCRAVRAYTPDISAPFVPVWKMHCRHCLSFVTGRDRKQKADPINNACSLDAPITDEEDGDTMADMIKDTSEAADVEAQALRAVYLEQLTADIMAALDELPAEEAALIRALDLERLGKDAAAAAAGLPAEAVQNTRQKALRKLRRNNTILSYAAYNLYNVPQREHGLEDLCIHIGNI